MTSISERDFYPKIATHYSESKSSLKEVSARLGNFGIGAGSALFSVSGLVIGLGETCFIWFPVGSSWEKRRLSILENLHNASLSQLAFGLIRTLNPAAPIDAKNDAYKLSHFYVDKIKEAAKARRSETDFFSRHVVSRVYFAGYAFASLFSRSIDLTLGVLGLVPVLFTLGQCERINSYVYNGFEGTQVFHDFVFGLFAIFNPDHPDYEFK